MWTHSFRRPSLRALLSQRPLTNDLSSKKLAMKTRVSPLWLAVFTPSSAVVRGLASISTVNQSVTKEVPKSPAFTVLFDSTNHWHRNMQYHPEQPARISSCLDAIDKLKRTEPGPQETQQHKKIDVAEQPQSPLQGLDREIPATHRPFNHLELQHARD